MSKNLMTDKQVREILKPYRKLVRGGDDLHKHENLRLAHYHIDIPEQVLITLIKDRERAARIEELQMALRKIFFDTGNIYIKARLKALSAPQVKEEL